MADLTPRLCALAACVLVGAATFAAPRLARAQNDAERKRIMKIAVNSASAGDIVSQLKALPRYSANSSPTFQAHMPDNTILADGTADEIRELKEAIRLIDVAPKKLIVRAELVLSVTDRAGHMHRATMNATGYTVHDRPVMLKTTLDGETVPDYGLVLANGRFEVRTHPRVNGDNTVTLDADGTADITFHAPGQPEPLHLQTSSSGSQRLKSGETLPLASRSMQIDSGKEQTLKAELHLFLTPTILDGAATNGAATTNAAANRKLTRG